MNRVIGGKGQWQPQCLYFILSPWVTQQQIIASICSSVAQGAKANTVLDIYILNHIGKNTINSQ